MSKASSDTERVRLAGRLVVVLALAACGHPPGIPDGGSTPDGDSTKLDASREIDAPPTDPACLAVDPWPSPIENPDGLAASQAELRFQARDGNTLSAFSYRSATFDPVTGPIVFIMHGVDRNAADYLAAWSDQLEQRGALGIAPEFPSTLYPSSESYSLGVGSDQTPSGGTYAPAEWRPNADYTLSEVEHLFEAVRIELGNASCRYLIYGHSAGAQFVHRLLTFRPDARVARAVAANAGWYTLPSARTGDDPNFYMPYGLAGAPPDPTRLERLFRYELVVLLGEDDVVRDGNLRTTVEADAQGLNRFERGHFYVEVAREAALSAGVQLGWTLDTVPGVGHSNAGMTPAAAEHLFGP